MENTSWQRNAALILFIASSIGCAPSVERTNEPTDADADTDAIHALPSRALAGITRLPVPGRALWQQRHGGAGDDISGGIAAMPDGGFALTGYFTDTFDLGCGPMTAKGSSDLFVARYDASGTCLWSRRAGGSGDQNGSGLAGARDGGLFVVGSYSGRSDLGGDMLPESSGLSGFVVRYDPQGNVLWASAFGQKGDTYPFDVAVAGEDLVVAGAFYATIDLGPGGTLTSVGDADAFVIRFDGARGTGQWSRSLGGPRWDAANGVAVDSAGNIVIGGTLDDEAVLGNMTLPGLGGSDAFIAKFGVDGTLLSIRRDGGSNDDSISDVAIDPWDNLLVAGYFQGRASFGGSDLLGAGQYTALAAKYDKTLTHVWSVALDASGLAWGGGIASDASGNTTICGSFVGNIDFGGSRMLGTGAQDVLVVQYSPSGHERWGRVLGGAGTAEGTALTVLGSGVVVLGGSFQQSLDPGLGTLYSSGDSDVLLVGFEN